MIDVHRICQLLAQVPQPPDETRPVGTSETECDAFELRNGIHLPDDVRQWLKIANGPCVGPGGFYGINPVRSHLDMESFLDLYPSWIRSKWIPVAGDGCGNYYIIPTQEEYGSGFPVLFIDTSYSSNDPLYIVASSVERFVIFLLEKEIGVEGWPFNEVYVSNSDPNILQFNNVAMPWAVD